VIPGELSAVARRSRMGPARVVIRYAFELRQQGKLAYVGDGFAMFVRGIAIG
jgi:hypothetical protein